MIWLSNYSRNKILETVVARGFKRFSHPNLTPDAALIWMAVVSGELIKRSCGGNLSEKQNLILVSGSQGTPKSSWPIDNPAETRPTKLLTSEMPASTHAHMKGCTSGECVHTHSQTHWHLQDIYTDPHTILYHYEYSLMQLWAKHHLKSFNLWKRYKIKSIFRRIQL